MFVARSVPVVFYRDQLAKEDRIPFVFYSGRRPCHYPLSSPTISRSTRPNDVLTMTPPIVGAGMLSILLFPITAFLPAATPPFRLQS